MNLIKRLTAINILMVLALAAAPGSSFAAITMISPAAGAVDVSQSPSLHAADLALGTSVQYHFQINTSADMTTSLYSFDQTVAQSFSSGGGGGHSAGRTPPSRSRGTPIAASARAPLFFIPHPALNLP